MNPKVYVAKMETWDGGLAIRRPYAIVERFHLKEGDDVEIVGLGGCEAERSQDADHVNALKRLRVFRGRLPADFTFDRSEPNER